MMNFYNGTTYKTLNTPENGAVLGVGSDDFSVTKPLKLFHVQNFYTWHFVISGSGYLDIEDKSFSIKSGDMFFIPPDVKMRYYPAENAPWKYVWFSLNGEAAERYRAILGFSQNTYVLKNHYSNITNGIFEDLFANLFEAKNRDFGILSSFYKIMDISVSQAPSNGIKNIKAVIDANCMSQFFSIENLCRDIGITHTHLLRLFKAEYGETVISYITKKRIGYARELLATTDLSVRAVASSCGFSDEFHFMKVFKRQNNITALQYRK